MFLKDCDFLKFYFHFLEILSSRPWHARLTEFRNLGLPAEFPQKGEICARMLVEEALLRGSADNVTVQVVFFS